MPLPIPNLSVESQREFLARCMGDKKMMDEFPKRNQRFSVCLSQLKNSN